MGKSGSMIKKFKNGNLRMKYDKDCNTFDAFINNDMFWSDLYINQINGYYYIVDFNKQLMYEIPYEYILRGSNVFHDELTKGLRLYALGKKETKSLFQDLENGY